jgi:glucose/arabinose dehydrogenase
VRAEYHVNRTFIPQVDQGPLKQLARPADARHDSTQGDSRNVCDLPVRKLLQLPEYQDLAVFRGQFRQGLLAPRERGAKEVISLKGFGHGHWTRSLLFDRGGAKLYVGVGSGSNVSPGEDPVRAAINRYNPDGSGHETYASGTRNPIGLHWFPGTDTLWAAVQERDALGDDLVPDYFTHIQQGGFYGWPYAYIGPNEDPRNKGQRPDLVAKTIVPDVPLMPAHQAVLDFEFYTAKQFPAEYRGGAFLAMHGSWNRAQRVGYKIAFIPFHDGKRSGAERDFLTGWMIAPDSRDVWGRPVGLLILPDGSLLISDDGGKKVWRVRYK